jgi:cobalt/nickel transport system permease protein
MRRNRAFTSTIVGITGVLGNALVSETVARQSGMLQSIDPRVRVIGLFLLILASTLSHRITAVLVVFAVAIVLATFSRVGLVLLATRVWLAVLFFTSVIALPALFLTPGTPILQTPGGLHITSQGLTSALLLIARVETAATLATLLVLTTPWMHILKALRSLRLPAEVVMMLAMTHRYIFLFAESAGQMLEARESRTVGPLSRELQRQVLSRSAGVLLTKSIEMSNDVYTAMQSRGFRGDVHVLVDFRMRPADYVALAGFVLIATGAIWMGMA